MKTSVREVAVHMEGKNITGIAKREMMESWAD